MRSDTIKIDNTGIGFGEAVAETKKVAAYTGLNEKKALRLQLMTEEMLSMARSVTGEMQASFWLENEGTKYTLHMSTKTVLDKDARYELISAATSRKNEAAKSFLGKLRDFFEEAMAAESDHEFVDLPAEIWDDIAGRVVEDTEYDGYERSVLRMLADDIKIGIRGGLVEMTISKDFAE